MFYSSSDVNDTFRMLHKYNINYILLHNIDNELPNKLKRGKDIDILVHPDCFDEFLKLMNILEYSELIHPHGKEAGWQFLYGMDTCHKFEHQKTGVQIDVYAQLATKSIDMDAWLPLDKSIQESVWRDKVWNDKYGWWQMDDKNLLVYLVTRSIFEKNEFTDGYIRAIEKLLYLLDDEKKDMADVTEKFHKIFFHFTPRLLKMLKDRDWKNIRKKYLSFDEY